MKIKTISVTYERKHNLGDYSSANIGITLWAELDESDNEKECAAELWSQAKSEVKAQLMPLAQKRIAEVEHAFAGLPVEIKNDILNGENGHAN